MRRKYKENTTYLLWNKHGILSKIGNIPLRRTVAEAIAMMCANHSQHLWHPQILLDGPITCVKMPGPSQQITLW